MATGQGGSRRGLPSLGVCSSQAVWSSAHLVRRFPGASRATMSLITVSHRTSGLGRPRWSSLLVLRRTRTHASSKMQLDIRSLRVGGAPFATAHHSVEFRRFARLALRVTHPNVEPLSREVLTRYTDPTCYGGAHPDPSTKLPPVRRLKLTTRAGNDRRELATILVNMGPARTPDPRTTELGSRGPRNKSTP